TARRADQSRFTSRRTGRDHARPGLCRGQTRRGDMPCTMAARRSRACLGAPHNQLQVDPDLAAIFRTVSRWPKLRDRFAPKMPCRLIPNGTILLIELLASALVV